VDARKWRSLNEIERIKESVWKWRGGGKGGEEFTGGYKYFIILGVLLN
jgi:hypothetical protein